MNRILLYARSIRHWDENITLSFLSLSLSLLIVGGGGVQEGFALKYPAQHREIAVHAL